MPPSDEKPRLLVVGDGDTPTGFGRVMQNVFGRLCDRYDVHHIAISYEGDPHTLPWKLYPAGVGGDPFGRARIPHLLRTLRPHLVFVLNDVWTVGDYVRIIRDENPRIPIVIYCPIETGPVDPSHIKNARGADRFVVYTEYARGEMERAIAQLPDSGFPPLDVIGHGVDTNVFHPCPDKRRTRELLFGGGEELVGSFIVLNANRNQPRKRIDTTIRGFALFAADKPANVKLYLHMGIEDKGWDVIRLARRHGIEDRLILTSRSHSIPAVPDEELNLIYNACDVGINTSVTEGWGLVSFEHAATRAAQIVPAHGAGVELWEGAAELLQPDYTLTAPLSLLEEKIITPEEVARTLELLYRDPERLHERSIAAFENAGKPQYQWNVIAGQWDELFRELLARDVLLPNGFEHQEAL